MYYYATDMLHNHGYNHYEISNYALKGMECRHNLKYWHCEDYIGVGLSAYSLFKERRFGNTRNYPKYIDGKDFVQYDEVLDLPEKAYEYVMLRLRLAEGFSLSEYKRLFGVDFLVGREAIIKELSDYGLIKLTDDNLSLTEKGFYVSNSILIKII